MAELVFVLLAALGLLGHHNLNQMQSSEKRFLPTVLGNCRSGFMRSAEPLSGSKPSSMMVAATIGGFISWQGSLGGSPPWCGW
jgi:hypothetical protein